jgi:hypothetical protein
MQLSQELIGKRARITRTVTRLQPTREWTGTATWEGKLTDGSQDESGTITGVCVLTDKRTRHTTSEHGHDGSLKNEHTWLAVGDEDNNHRHWSTRIEFLN